MEATSVKDNLYKGLNTIARAIPGRAAIPIVQNVLITTTQDGITLTATNLSMTITTKVEAIVARQGAITIPGRMLTEFVSTLPNEPVKISTPPGSMVANLSCAKAHANINGADPADFPPIPAISDGLTASIKAGDLKTAISRTAFAAAKEDARPILTGINLKITKDTMVLAAADGFRLAVNKTALQNPGPADIDVVIPASTLQQLLRLMGEDQEEVEITADPEKSQIKFKVGNTDLVSLLVAGEFPDYTRLVPTNQDTKCVMKTKTLLSAAKTASIFAREAGNIIRLEMTANGKDDTGPSMLISAQADEVGSNTDHILLDQQWKCAA